MLPENGSIVKFLAEEMEAAWAEASKDFRPTHEIMRGIVSQCGENSWSSLPQQRQYELCTHRSGLLVRVPVPGQGIKIIPIYCNLAHCEACNRRKGGELQKKFEQAQAKGLADCPGGKWFRIVSENSDSAKKQISRKHGKRHMQADGTVYCFTNQPEAGWEEANPTLEINWMKLYKQNRESGHKLSFGAGLRPNMGMAEKEATEKMLLVGFLVEEEDQLTFEEIMRNRFAQKKEAETFEDLQKEYVKIILEILEMCALAGVKIIALKEVPYNLPIETTIKLWRDEMSVKASIDNNNIEANTDIWMS